MNATTAAARVCADCGRPPCKKGLVRGHCNTCYHRHYRHGTHLDLPGARKRADVVDDYLHLRAYGDSRRQIADRLGMSKDALDQALKRAALAGDTRIDYQPRRAA